MDLKEQLEGLKNDLTNNFDTKSKLDIQTAIESVEAKIKADKDALKGEFDKEIEAIKVRLDYIEKGLEKSELFLDKRLDHLNEFRETLKSH